MRLTFYLLCAIFLAPFVALAAFALSSVDLATWWLHVVELKSVARSVLCGLVAGLAATLLGGWLAYQVSFHRFPLRRLMEKLLVLPLLFPTFVLAAIYRDLLAPVVDLESTGGFVFIMAVGLFPYAYLLCRLSFQSHGRAFLELGQSLGLSLSKSFTRILLPLTLPALLLGAGLVFIETAGEWATATLLSADTSALAIHRLWFARGSPALATQLALLLLVVVLVVLVPIGRWARKWQAHYLGMASSTPRAGQAKGTGPAAWARLAACMLPCLLGLVVPLATVVVYFFQTAGVIDLSRLLANSLSTLGLLAAVITVCLAFALVINAARRRAGGLAIGWFTLSFLVPGTVLAVGSMILAGHTPLFGERYGDFSSFVILTLTLAIRFVCFLLIPLYIGRSFLARQVDEAGATLGLDRTRTFFRLKLPYLRMFALLGILLLIVQLLRETAISLALHPFSFQTLALKTWAYIDLDLLPESSAWILATALMGLYPLLTIESMLSSRNARGN